jgi:hypothetical protein
LFAGAATEDLHDTVSALECAFDDVKEVESERDECVEDRFSEDNLTDGTVAVAVSNSEQALAEVTWSSFEK